jgi:hypothetical protein
MVQLLFGFRIIHPRAVEDEITHALKTPSMLVTRMSVDTSTKSIAAV